VSEDVERLLAEQIRFDDDRAPEYEDHFLFGTAGPRRDPGDPPV
jgi:hypothetical protein